MGWLPSFLGGEKSNDPLTKLDPKLREFLEKESPVKYSKKVDAVEPAPTRPQQPTTPQDKPTVPAESLYQDGRYAHLWKNYKPLAQVEDEGSSDHDKLMNVLDGYKERKAAIGKAAMENCAMQQEEWINCMKHGDWSDQLQMCRHQVRRYERCYTMQSRFLKVLGYGSVLGRAPQVEEDIQMHADSLFQRMLNHEKAVAKAKEEGTPIPVFDSVLPQEKTEVVRPSAELEKQWREKLSKLPEDERAAEEAALRADLQIKSDVAKNVKQIWDSKKDEREARQASGQGTFGDTISSLFGGKK
ncbi:hypothetical protein Golomagni_05707 [Golovinomyces magnicellulatus]|nr:hypothetical protein Golomagni_05707 [Golovinomyces magnicellulatus]